MIFRKYAMRKYLICNKVLLLLLVIGFCFVCPISSNAQVTSSNYPQMAQFIVNALEPATGERAIVRYHPQAMSGLEVVLKNALQQKGVEAMLLQYGPAEDFAARLDNTDIYIWLPEASQGSTPPAQMQALHAWLVAGKGRQIHFHWAAGTVDNDGLAGEHSAAYDSIYLAALDIDYNELNRWQEFAIDRFKSGEVRVTTPEGTDIRFRVGDRPFTKQNGDASKAATAKAGAIIGREIELPAGALRVAPVESSVHGTIVIPSARFGDAVVKTLRLDFTNGRITKFSAIKGEEVLRNTLASAEALYSFREFALGFNPNLNTPSGHKWIAYYGYGHGIVRLSLGNNEELGGAVRGTGVRWFFFNNVTVEVSGKKLVDSGRLMMK